MSLSPSETVIRDDFDTFRRNFYPLDHHNDDVLDIFAWKVIMQLWDELERLKDDVKYLEKQLREK